MRVRLYPKKGREDASGETSRDGRYLIHGDKERSSVAAIARRGPKSSRLAGPPLFADKPMMDRIGFLIRRLHQIHLALFFQEAGGLDITTIQFTALSVLHQSGEIDQSEIALQVGMDRTNVSEVIRRLASRGYVKIRINPKHGRKRLISLTTAGLQFLKKADQCAKITQDRTIAPLSARQRQVFAKLLRHLVQEQNALGRSPLRLK